MDASTHYDYDTRPALSQKGLARVTHALAIWLPSDRDGGAVADWDAAQWAAAEWVAYWQNAVPWLAKRIADTNAPVPADVLARLMALAADCRERTRRMLNAAAEMFEAFDRLGIEAIPLKGAVLAPLYYDDPSLRPMGDIDVLIAPERLGEAGQVMRDLGYRFYSRSDEDEVYLRGEYKPNMWAPDNVHPIELHFRLREEYAGLIYDLAPAMWRGSQRQGYWGGTQARVPAPSVLLHHVCAHATSDWIVQRGRLMHLDDVRRLAARMTEGDWQAFSAGVPAEGARYVYPMLYWARDMARAAVPDEVLARLRADSPPALRDWAERIDLASTSIVNPAMRSGIGFEIIDRLARSPRERLHMLWRSVFPRRWNLTKRYPRLIATPFWPLCYLLLNVDRLGHVICIGGGVGIAAAHPVAKAFRAAGNNVIGIIGAKNVQLLFYEDEMRAACTELIVTTDDGSRGSPQKRFGLLLKPLVDG